MPSMARKTIPCGIRASPAPIPKSAGTMGVTNDFRNMIRTVRVIIGSCMSNPVPLKTCRVGQRCTLNLSRAETSSRWCGVVVRRGGVSSGVVHVP
ncbi:hypothetical protein TNCV_1521931 [Trichonephila clavipes]|nr:hypothetical protein TNCV_1521931 [Trichonephila clavipes]